MSEYDDLIDGFEGAPSSEGERRPDVAEVPGSTPGGLIESHGMIVGDQSTADAFDEILGTDEPPIEPDDWPELEPWPEPPAEVPLFADLRPLKPDQRPLKGVHFVVYDGKPVPVMRENFGATEDEFVRSQLDTSDTLRDHDGQRRVRADRTLRMRYRGYVCGEMSSL